MFDFCESLSCDLNLWVRFALQHKVEELYLDICTDLEILMHQLLYSSSSIRKLHLLDCVLEVHGKIHWDQLKSLTTDGVSLDQSVIERVLSGAGIDEEDRFAFSSVKFEKFDARYLTQESQNSEIWAEQSSLQERLIEWNWLGESLIPEIEEIELSDSFLMHLRIVRIKWFCYETSILPSIEFVLKHASLLEKMAIEVRMPKSVGSECSVPAAQKLFENVKIFSRC
ncbi:unnamed protein product [Fraxinus pennsylvanica]|uniref:Uncharacterized protein n=1 Tax=Fraxinus pennsylvanica TaxID=56036 RepID=A0AAD1ZBG1_9LAMI|nr:unnamed protein product [Fraxinus pennsylvanica]